MAGLCASPEGMKRGVIAGGRGYATPSGVGSVGRRWQHTRGRRVGMPIPEEWSTWRHYIAGMKTHLYCGSTVHIVSSKKFHRISSSPHYSLPNDNYDSPEKVCGERKYLIALSRNEARNNFLMSGPGLSIAKLRPLLFSAPRWR